jgi:hypothetical protein
MNTKPRNLEILKLWEARQELLEKAGLYSNAIGALQALCDHKNEFDTSYHGTPTYECPDCGNTR